MDKISAEDRMEVENLYLKVTNLDYQRKLLIKDIMAAEKLIGEYQQKLRDKEAYLKEKYGITDVTQLGTDGTITR